MGLYDDYQKGAGMFKPAVAPVAPAPAPVAVKQNTFAGLNPRGGNGLTVVKPPPVSQPAPVQAVAETKASQVPLYDQYKTGSGIFAPAPVPVKESPQSVVTPQEERNLFGEGIDVVSNFIKPIFSPFVDRPTYKEGESTFRQFLYEVPENIPFGFGQAMKDIRQSDPAAIEDLNAGDVARSVGPVLVDTAKGFAKAPISGALNLTGKTKIDIPGLGEVTSAQYRAAERVSQGEDPWKVILTEAPGAILDTLFFVSLASKPFQGRPETVAKSEVSASNLKGAPADVAVTGPRTFRLYEQPVVTKPLPQEMITKAQQQGVTFSKSYDPSLPSYFRLQPGKPGPSGTVVGEIVQVKPSYFSMFKEKVLSTGIKDVPANQLTVVHFQEVKNTDVRGVVAPLETAPMIKESAKVESVKPGSTFVPPVSRPTVAPSQIRPVTHDPSGKLAPKVQAPEIPLKPTIEESESSTPALEVTSREIPEKLSALAAEARKFDTPQKFIEAQATKPFNGLKPIEKIETVPAVGSVVKTKLSTAEYKVIEVIEDRLRVQRTGATSSFVVNARDVTEIVKGKKVPYAPRETTQYALQAAEQIHGPALKKAGFENLEDFYNEAHKTPTKNLTIQPEVPVREKIKGQGNTLVNVATIKGERVETPTPLITKTQVKEMLSGLGKKSVAFEVIERDGKKFMSHKTDKQNILLRPSALGLVEENIKVGDTVTIDTGNLKKTGTSFRAMDEKGEVSASPRVGGGASASAGAQKIGTFEKAKAPVSSENPNFKLYTKVHDLIKKYAERVGEGYLPSGAAGVFYHNTKNIRLTGMNDLSVAAHEIAHYLDKANKISEQIMKVKGLGLTGNPIYESGTYKVRRELSDLYVRQYPGGKPTHNLRKRMVEGFATLLQKYTEAPITTAQNYPNLVKEFLKPGGTYYEPVIGEILADLKGIVEDYQALDSLDKVGARVTSDINKTGKETFLNWKEKVRTEVADEVYPIEKLAIESGTHMTKDDPSLWVRQYNNSSSIVMNNLKGSRGYWGYRGGDFVKLHDFNWGTLMKAVEKEKMLDQFGNYLVARDQYFNYQELDRLEKALRELKKLKATLPDGKTPEIDPTLARIFDSVLGRPIDQLIKEANAKYEELKMILDHNGFTETEVTEAYMENKGRFTEYEKQFDALTQEDLSFLHNEDVGLIDKKAFDSLTSKEGYASLKREFYDDIVGDEATFGVGSKGKASSLKARTGSSRTIINPMLSGIKNHAEIVRKGLRQIVYNKVVKIALKNGLPQLFQPQKLQVVPDPKTGMVLYPQERDPNIVMARIGYKRTPVLVDATIKNTLDDILNFKNVTLFEKLLTAGSRFFTKGTTGLYAPFAATNAVIDQITALAQTQHNYIPIYSPLKELFSYMQDRTGEEARLYQEYMVMGGERQTFAGWQDLSAKELAQKIAKEREGILRALDAVNKGMDILALPSKYSEIMTRVVEYIKARKAGHSQIVSMEKAGRITAPFHHVGRLGGGSVGKSFVKSIPFFNPGIQVLDQAARTVADKNGRNRYAAVTLAVVASMIAAQQLLQSLATDEQKDQYKDLSVQELAKYIWLPSSDGKSLIKIRIPDQMGELGAIINMALSNMSGEGNFGTGDFVTAGTSFLPQQVNITNPSQALFSLIPQIVKPLLQVITNTKDFPNIQPLEGPSMLSKPREFRENKGTSGFAKSEAGKAIGELFGISPIQMDFLITGYLGRATGFVTIKPGIYDPLKGFKQDYYLESGRRLQEYYEKKKENDQQYSVLRKGIKSFTAEEVSDLMLNRGKLKAVTELLDAYQTIEPDKNSKLAEKVRDQIFKQLETLK